MKLLPLIASIVFCLSAPLSGAAATAPNDTTYIFLKDYGLHRTKRKNGIKYINKALPDLQGDAPKVLVFTPGKYHFYPDGAQTRVYYESKTADVTPKVCAFLFRNIHNLTIDGRGSMLIFHQQMQPFTFDNCRNIVLKNLYIDWDNPLLAEAEVLKANKHYVDLAIDYRQTPYRIENEKLFFDVGRTLHNPWNSGVEFDRKTRIIVPQGGLGENWQKYRAVATMPGIVRLYNAFERLPQKGNTLVMQHAEATHAGIWLTGSENVRVQNLTLYHAAGPGILAQFSKNLSFSACRFVPNRAETRYASGIDSGIRVANCRGQVNIVNCEFAGLMNTSVQLTESSMQVTEIVHAKQLKCSMAKPMGLQWGHQGDTICFVENEKMLALGSAEIESCQMLDSATVLIGFNNKIPEALAPGDVLQNLSGAPRVLVQQSNFGNGPASGILLSTSGKVRIENNVFETGGSAILVGGDVSQRNEVGAARDVLIRNNTFNETCFTTACPRCEAIISICPTIQQLSKTTPPFHQNIRIVGNRFQPFDYPLLFARSTAGIEFSHNTVTRSFNYPAWHPRHYTFSFEYCRKIRIEQNTFSTDIAGKNILLKKTPTTQLELDTPSFFEIEKL